MQESESQDPEATEAQVETDLEEEDVFFRDVSEDLDDEERTSYAILLILAVGGFAVGALLLQITWTSAATLREYAGDWAWVLAPAPMLLFGLASIWQYEATWLQRLGAAALGFALAQYIMIAIGFSTLEI
jgi:hypothetical protein